MASLFGRLEIVRLVEVHRVDLVDFDELDDVHGLRGLGIHRRKIFVVQHHVLPLLVLVPLDDLVPRYGLSIDAADALVLYASFVFRVQHIEGKVVGLYGREEFDRNRNEAEIYRPRPDCMRHRWIILPKVQAAVYPGCDQSRRALPIAGSSRCFFQTRALHKSPSRSKRLGAVRIVYFANSSAGAAFVRRRANDSTSDQCSGVETGAPSRARTEYGATIVLPRPTWT